MSIPGLGRALGGFAVGLALWFPFYLFRMLGEGKVNQQIIDFMVDRYGDFVRYKPPVNLKTLALWYGPIAMLVVGFVLVLAPGGLCFARRNTEMRADN